MWRLVQYYVCARLRWCVHSCMVPVMVRGEHGYDLQSFVLGSSQHLQGKLGFATLDSSSA